MGRRQEQRIPLRVPVTVRGKDRFNHPFVQTAQTLDVSCSGVRLDGVECLLGPGAQVEVEYHLEKALYQVQWVGEEGTPLEGQVGLRCLELGKFIWGVSVPESHPDEYDSSAPKAEESDAHAEAPAATASSSWDGAERRRHPRMPFRGQSEVVPEGAAVRLAGTMADLSLGGCYMEMLSPLPADTPLELTLDLGGPPIHSKGRVRFSQPGMGMGIEFTAMSEEDRQKLARLVAPAANGQPPPATGGPESSAARVPPAASAPARGSSAASVTEALEALMHVLFRKGLVTRTELSEEIFRLKAGKAGH